MVTIVKHEWHSHDRQYAIELDEDLLSEIYPDLDEDEISEKLKQIEEGEIDVEDVINDAWENDVDIDWDFQYDDCWTDRKGGYDITYEIGDESSWHTEPEPDPATHKCTKCRWDGSNWETRTVYIDEQGSVLPDDIEEWHDTRDGCPMCDSVVELTEFGVQKENERAERQRKWDEENSDDNEIDLGDEEEPYHAECTSCEWSGPEEDTQTIEGQMCCPECREPVFTAEQVLEQRKENLETALQELKDDFEKLMENDGVIVEMKCTHCDWKGDWTQTETKEIDGIDTDVCPKCGNLVEEVSNE